MVFYAFSDTSDISIRSPRRAAEGERFSDTREVKSRERYPTKKESRSTKTFPPTNRSCPVSMRYLFIFSSTWCYTTERVIKENSVSRRVQYCEVLFFYRAQFIRPLRLLHIRTYDLHNIIHDITLCVGTTLVPLSIAEVKKKKPTFTTFRTFTF